MIGRKAVYVHVTYIRSTIDILYIIVIICERFLESVAFRQNTVNEEVLCTRNKDGGDQNDADNQDGGA